MKLEMMVINASTEYEGGGEPGVDEVAKCEGVDA